MQGYDVLVETIFDALNKRKESPEDKRCAMARAGLIAQAYALDANLLFENNDDVHLDLPRGGSSSGSA